MFKALVVIFLLILVSCGKNGKDGSDGSGGATIFGANGTSTGIDMLDIDPGLVCANGGISIFTFKDLNSDGIQQSSEEIVKIKSLCNGINGEDGANGENSSTTLESIASSSACPNGGVKISSGENNPVEICNGSNGLNGEQGIQGVQGIPGMVGSSGANGADGTIISPVKFCVSDTSTFPEYGLLIGNELFAVYFGTTPASPSTPQAFLTKLIAGNYRSTGGNNCLFRVD